MFVPSKMFFTRGKGVAREKLTSFEAALRNAGISPFNLVTVSSIFPPHCRVIARKRGIALLRPGEITFCVMARNATNERGRLIAAATGVAIPKDRTKYGYISEHREEYNPGKIDKAVREAIVQKIEYWIGLLGSAGKA